MAEVARLIGLLQASKIQLFQDTSSHGKPPECGFTCLNPLSKHSEEHDSAFKAASTPAPFNLVEPFQLVAKVDLFPPEPAEPRSEHFKTGFSHVHSTPNVSCPPNIVQPVPIQQVEETTKDLTNELVVATSKRIFAAANNPQKLKAIAYDLHPQSEIMAGRFPVLSTSNLPPASASEQSATASPARGTAMLNNIFKNVRVPEFRFKWQFWAEKGQQAPPSSKDKSSVSDDYASRPRPLGETIISIREFYQHFNNIPTDSLKLRDSIHLFHLGVKPLWEDPRNLRGGAWYFRIGKEVAGQFWHEICLLAVGDVLQGAVETKREGKSIALSIFYTAALGTDSYQHSMMTSAAFRTLFAGTQYRSLSGTETQRTRPVKRSC
jgi:hypothetical protein